MSDQPRRPSALELDRRALGLLDEAEAARIDAAIAAHPDLAAEVAADAEARRDFSTRVFPKTLDRVQEKVAGRRRSGMWMWMPMLAAPLAAAAVLVLWLGRPEQRPSVVGVEPDIMIKGGPALEVYARRGLQVLPISDGDRLAAGDAIRFVVQPAQYTHVLVLSVDGAGQVNVYVPFEGTESMEIAGRSELPGSVVLDEAAGPERVYAFFSAEPIAAAEVIEQLKPVAASGESGIRAGRPVQVPGTRQVSVLFEKESQ